MRFRGDVCIRHCRGGHTYILSDVTNRPRPHMALSPSFLPACVARARSSSPRVQGHFCRRFSLFALCFPIVRPEVCRGARNFVPKDARALFQDHVRSVCRHLRTLNDFLRVHGSRENGCREIKLDSPDAGCTVNGRCYRTMTLCALVLTYLN